MLNQGDEITYRNARTGRTTTGEVVSRFSDGRLLVLLDDTSKRTVAGPREVSRLDLGDCGTYSCSTFNLRPGYDFPASM